MEDRLRQRYAVDRPEQLAAELGVTIKALRSRAKVLRVQRLTKRPWTAEEDAFLIKYYPDRTCRWCAGLLQRNIGSVYAHAAALGLNEKRIVLNDRELIAALERYHPQGWSDSEIVAQLLKDTGIKTDRHRLSELRRSMGMGDNTRSTHRRQQVAAKTRQQLDAAGMLTLAEYRNEQYNQWKRELGWPDTLTVRAVQAAELLKRHGPMTRVQLCLAMGVKPTERTQPKSNARGGTVLAELARAGIVGRLRRAIKVPIDLAVHDEPMRQRQRKVASKYLDLYFIVEQLVTTASASDQLLPIGANQ